MESYRYCSKIRNGAATSEVGLSKQGDIIVGEFIDRGRPGYLQAYREEVTEKLRPQHAEEGVLT